MSAEGAEGIGGKSVLRTRRTFRELVETLSPEVLTSLAEEVEERLSRIPNQLNVYKYDPWGFHPDSAKQLYLLQTLLYRYWFRVENFGIENLPRERCLLIANHAGQIALDAAMICTAALLEAEPPRIVRGMGEFWLATLPFLSVIMHRFGSVIGTPKNCVDLLENEEAVVAFPEGVRGISKLFWDRYRLEKFGTGFMRIAIEAGAPIVPVAVVGSEEQAIAVANWKALGERLGMPAFPITATWPWLGPLGLVPLPVKYRIYWGKPLRFDGNPNDEDEQIEKKVEKVRGKIQEMLNEGLAERKSWFR